jgi:hypothetical protein
MCESFLHTANSNKASLSMSPLRAGMQATSGYTARTPRIYLANLGLFGIQIKTGGTTCGSGNGSNINNTGHHGINHAIPANLLEPYNAKREQEEKQRERKEFERKTKSELDAKEHRMWHYEAFRRAYVNRRAVFYPESPESFETEIFTELPYHTKLKQETFYKHSKCDYKSITGFTVQGDLLKIYICPRRPETLIRVRASGLLDVVTAVTRNFPSRNIQKMLVFMAPKGSRISQSFPHQHFINDVSAPIPGTLWYDSLPEPIKPFVVNQYLQEIETKESDDVKVTWYV